MKCDFAEHDKLPEYKWIPNPPPKDSSDDENKPKSKL